ncbi:MAG: YHS domain-containing (seleno)protein [Kiloniellales bacterium]
MSYSAASLRSLALVIGLGLATLGFGAAGALAAEEVNIVDGYAIHGYDAVAYFTKGEPTEGKDEFVAEHDGARYRFASAGNRDAFRADPAKYAPQYGGFCAYGTAQGRKVDGDPEARSIVDGKLYLNINRKVHSLWNEDTAGYIRGSNHNWPIIEAIPDSDLADSPPETITLGAQ